MLLSRYFSRSLLYTLSTTSKNNLGLYQPIILGNSINYYCFSSLEAKENSKKDQHFYVTLHQSNSKSSRGRSKQKVQIKRPKPKTWFGRFDDGCESVLNFTCNILKSKFVKLVTALIGWALAIIGFCSQAFGKNLVTGFIEKRVKERKEYIQIEKSKKKEQLREILQKNSNKQEQDFKTSKLELKEFQYQNYSYRDQLKSMLNSKDNKLIFYIESFVGDSVATNLKRLARQITFSEDMSDQQKKQAKFKKLYYISLKDPASSNLTKDEDSEWGLAKDLNYLLTSIIATDQQKKGWLERVQDMLMTDEQLQKNKKPKNSILIIDEAQLLQSFLNDKKKKQKLEQVYQKIFYAQKNKNVMIYIIANNNSFFHRFNRQLESPNLEDYKHEFIGCMNADDIKNIIKIRSKIDKFYKSQKRTERYQQFNSYFDKIIDYLVDINDNIRELMRIIKYGEIDLKHNIRNLNLSKNIQIQEYQQAIRDQIDRKYFKDESDQSKKPKAHYEAIKDIKTKILTTSEDFIIQKKNSIINQFCQVSSHLQKSDEINEKRDETSGKSNEKSQEKGNQIGQTQAPDFKVENNQVLKNKLEILLFIFSKKSRRQQSPTQKSTSQALKNPTQPQDEKFLFKMTKSQALAYEQLNKAEIIHGLRFSSKAYERAFFYILRDHKEVFDSQAQKMKLHFYKQNFTSHKDRVQNFKQYIEGMQKKFDDQFGITSKN